MSEPQIIVNNGKRLAVAFTDGYSGPAGFTELQDRALVAFPGTNSPPVGSTQMVDGRHWLVQSVTPSETMGGITSVVLLPQAQG